MKIRTKLSVRSFLVVSFLLGAIVIPWAWRIHRGDVAVLITTRDLSTCEQIDNYTVAIVHRQRNRIPKDALVFKRSVLLKGHITTRDIEAGQVITKEMVIDGTFGSFGAIHSRELWHAHLMRRNLRCRRPSIGGAMNPGIPFANTRALDSSDFCYVFPTQVRQNSS